MSTMWQGWKLGHSQREIFREHKQPKWNLCSFLLDVGLLSTKALNVSGEDETLLAYDKMKCEPISNITM